MGRRLLITGSSSLVGSHFVQSYGKKHEISALGRRNIFEGTNLLASFKRLELTQKSQLQEAVRASNAEFVVNYAAETNVDGCETEKGNLNGSVYTVNTLAARWLAEVCKETGRRLYHISTDFVFDGSSGPYGEEDETGPLKNAIGWYGYTKYLAEKELMKRLPESCIIRISYPYRASFQFKTDFARNILRLFHEGKLFPLFTDQVFSPTLVDDASGAIDFLMERDARGIYHVGSRYPTTPFDFASTLVSTFFSVRNPEDVLKKALMAEFARVPGRAPRSMKGGLKTQKIVATGYTPKTVIEGIQEMFRQSVEQGSFIAAIETEKR